MGTLSGKGLLGEVYLRGQAFDGGNLFSVFILGCEQKTNKG
jgi:hypothetical protein